MSRTVNTVRVVYFLAGCAICLGGALRVKGPVGDALTFVMDNWLGLGLAVSGLTLAIVCLAAAMRNSDTMRLERALVLLTGASLMVCGFVLMLRLMPPPLFLPLVQSTSMRKDLGIVVGLVGGVLWVFAPRTRTSDKS